MKLLVVRSSSGESNNDPGWYFYKTVFDMGIDVKQLNYGNIIRYQKFANLKNSFNKITSSILKRTDLRFNLYARANNMLLKMVSAEKPDVVVVFKGWGLNRELINQIKSLNRDVKLINIYSDNIFLHGPSVMMAQCYDRIYVKDTYVLNKLYSIGISNARLLWEACYPKEHRKLSSNELANYPHIASEISLIGSLYPYRVNMLETLREFDLKIWGNVWGFDDQKNYKSSYASTVHQGCSVDGEKKLAIYNLSKINLNTIQPLECIHGSNSRVHQIASCQQFQLQKKTLILRNNMRLEVR